MWLHSQGVTGLGEDLKQLIVGEEVEAREEEPLGLQVVLQALLDLLQEGVIGLEGFQQACMGGGGGGGGGGGSYKYQAHCTKTK